MTTNLNHFEPEPFMVAMVANMGYHYFYNMSDFGKLIRAKRVAAGMSLRQFADRLGKSHVFVGEVERGTRPAFKLELWPRLLELLPNLTEDELKQAAELSRPVQFDVAQKSRPVQDLVLALRRRISEDTLRADQVHQIMRVLGGEDDDSGDDD